MRHNRLDFSTLRGSLMIQGCTSDAGKSLCVTALCRVLQQEGVAVAPFKPQNMALNSAVTACGGEIGRAQALQAVACGLAPHIDFNPVLLKPSSDQTSQVIIHGRAVSQLEAARFGNIKALAFESVLQSYQRLQRDFQVVLIEGAGSPAEVNLRQNDIANMGFAEAVDCPVALIADIDRGGVFAHLVGTLSLLSASEQARVTGFIINKFRGHLSLLQDGLDWLEERCQRPVFGVVPYLHGLKLDAEDAIKHETHGQAATLTIKVPILPRMSNHTDFEPLKWHPQVDLQFVSGGESLLGADLIILPGSKSVRADLAFLREQGWDQQIQRHCRFGGKLLGICGGMQMLGQSIADPEGIEGEAGASAALGYLPFTTVLHTEKQLKNVEGICRFGSFQAAVRGYEIHCGVSQGRALDNAFAEVVDQRGQHYQDGVGSDDGDIVGTYLHGLFEHQDALAALLNWLGLPCESAPDWQRVRESELDRIADCYRQHLNLNQLLAHIA